MRLFIKCGDMGLNCEVSSVVCESGIQRGGVMQRVPDVTTRIFFLAFNYDRVSCFRLPINRVSYNYTTFEFACSLYLQNGQRT